MADCCTGSRCPGGCGWRRWAERNCTAGCVGGRRRQVVGRLVPLPVQRYDTWNRVPACSSAAQDSALTERRRWLGRREPERPAQSSLASSACSGTSFWSAEEHGRMSKVLWNIKAWRPRKERLPACRRGWASCRAQPCPASPGRRSSWRPSPWCWSARQWRLCEASSQTEGRRVRCGRTARETWGRASGRPRSHSLRSPPLWHCLA